MRFVNNAFSSKMVENMSVKFEVITEDEFMVESHKSDVVSCIGHPDTAKLFNLKENRTTIHLNSGDILFVCELNNSTGTRLPEGLTRMEEIPDGFSFRFLKITAL